MMDPVFQRVPQLSEKPPFYDKEMNKFQGQEGQQEGQPQHQPGSIVGQGGKSSDSGSLASAYEQEAKSA